MDDALRQALAARLLALADDELILGHRDSEWCGHAPILEEDIAFANIALDEQGHAAVWYGVYVGLLGLDKDTAPDDLAFLRGPQEFRCAPLVELPKGDWAFTMLRQYLFDASELALMERLVGGSYAPVREAADKVRREEFYHLRHTGLWVRRLGLGTEVSAHRMQVALEEVWMPALTLFEPLSGDTLLAQASLFPAVSDWRAAWEAQVRPFLTDAGLAIPGVVHTASFSRTAHTPHLAELLDEMQQVRRLQPDARW